jgi:hypothetical protein
MHQLVVLVVSDSNGAMDLLSSAGSRLKLKQVHGTAPALTGVSVTAGNGMQSTGDGYLKKLRRLVKA